MLLPQPFFLVSFFTFIPMASGEMEALALALALAFLHLEDLGALYFLPSFYEASFVSSSWPLL